MVAAIIPLLKMTVLPLSVTVTFSAAAVPPLGIFSITKFEIRVVKRRIMARILFLIMENLFRTQVRIAYKPNCYTLSW